MSDAEIKEIFRSCWNMLEEGNIEEGARIITSLESSVLMSVLQIQDESLGGTIATKAINLMDPDTAAGGDLLNAVVSVGTADLVEVLKTPDASGSTPLHIACKRSSLTAVKIIMQSTSQEHRMDLLFVTDEDLSTPLHVAAKCARPEVMKYLLELGQPLDPSNQINLLNTRDRSGQTPLHLALQNTSYEKTCLEILKFLRKTSQRHPEVIDDIRSIWMAVEKHCQTALHYAAKFASAEMVEYLLAELPLPTLGALLRQRDDHGEYPLHVAAKRKDGAVLHSILKFACIARDAEGILSSRTDNGDTFVHTASHHCQMDAIKQMVAAIPRQIGYLLKDQRNWKGKKPRELASSITVRDQLDQLGEYATAIYSLQTRPTVIIATGAVTQDSGQYRVEEDKTCVMQYFQERKFLILTANSNNLEAVWGEAQTDIEKSALIVYYLVPNPDYSKPHRAVERMISEPKYAGTPKVLVMYDKKMPLPDTPDLLTFTAQTHDAITTHIKSMKMLALSDCISKACRNPDGQYGVNGVMESTFQKKFCIGKNFEEPLTPPLDFTVYAEHPVSESSGDESL